MRNTQKFFLLLFILTFSCDIVAQTDYKNYYININKSNTFTDVDSILKYKLNALQFAKPLPDELLSIGFHYYGKKNIGKASYYFHEAFKRGYQIEPDEAFKDLPYRTEYKFGFISEYVNSATPFATFMNAMFTINKNKIRKLRKDFITNVDKIEDSKYEVLLQNELNFQKIRIEILPNKQIPDSIMPILFKYLNIGNSYYMLELLQNNTFPSRYKCRRFNGQSFYMLVNHAIAGFANEEDAKLFIDLLWKQVENGNMSTDDYSKAVDHYTSWYVNPEKSLLGTSMKSEDFKTFQLNDVINPDQLNELRAKYWLGTIEQYSQSTGFLLPKNYIIK